MSKLDTVREAREAADKASLELVKAIRAAVADGHSQAEVGRAAKLTRGRINQLVRRGNDG